MKYIIGKIKSAKMNQTVVVVTDRSRPHPKYGKRITKTSKFMAHNELEAKVGDTVKIMETAPVSRLKRWKVVEVIK
ncbi:MAG: 30S ribosomal protein S17 [Candidatus Amesbacteria bacterium GW2011_GWA2_42_12]|uniref:Small ribosomal subunit protein uS17 n=1 Tax=Candidatus Amesbacteria bacterium GW2011_GWA2_42_12 TaxID=1618356 RepID=A0A0G0Y960_9BACT|nr:MAG: 30S ribosomal protein S17 [Candidatus Amesbacteria bacterium GW2011_GWA2_42_12]